jgi:hypothetical protein
MALDIVSPEINWSHLLFSRMGGCRDGRLGSITSQGGLRPRRKTQHRSSIISAQVAGLIGGYGVPGFSKFLSQSTLMFLGVRRPFFDGSIATIALELSGPALTWTGLSEP